MQQPASLPGFEAPSRRGSHNLFFALWPDATIRARIAETAATLRREKAAAGRWIKPYRYHLTLQFLGEHASLPRDLVESALAAAARVESPAFALALDLAGSFGNARIPCWIGCREMPAGLQLLFGDLARALIAERCRVHGHAQLVPHVTILRDADRPLHRQLESALRWTVDEFVLIDSQIEPATPYRMLGRWQLR